LRTETKAEKKARLLKAAEAKAKGEKPAEVPKPPPTVKCGLNHVTHLVEQKVSGCLLVPV
jgi:hypothetical protein